MEALKRELWDRWGSPNHPAEWDGIHYGGGKGSQRFWEYLWAIGQLDGRERNILDVGAGPTLFLPSLLRVALPRVEALDPELPHSDDLHHRTTLRAWMDDNPSAAERFDCITCVSVIEHLPDPTELFRDLARFRKAKIVVTLELGFQPPGFDYQLTMHGIYAGLNCFTTHYLSRMETCPVWADNSNNGHWRPFGMVLLPKEA